MQAFLYSLPLASSIIGVGQDSPPFTCTAPPVHQLPGIVFHFAADSDYSITHTLHLSSQLFHFSG